MTTFKGPEVLVNLSSTELFEKLSDLRNLKNIMPSEIKKFEANKESCMISMDGMPSINMEIREQVPYDKISLSSKDSPIKFTLICYIQEKGNECQARLEVNTDANMMIKMMIEKPINNFLNILSNQLQQL